MNASGNSANVRVAAGDHPLQQGDIAGDVLNDGRFVQKHSAAGRRALCRSVAKFEGLLHLQVRQSLNLKDAPRENIFLSLFRNRQQTGFDGVKRDRVDQVTQGHTRLHLSFKPHQYALGHI